MADTVAPSAAQIEYSGPDRFALYRLYDTEGRLLYVGATDDLKVRLAIHAKAKPWWQLVARTTVEWHKTRASALTAEAAAIRAESPVYNVIYGIAAPVGGGGKNGLHTRSQTAFRLDPALLAKLKARAESDGCTMTDIVHEALAAYFDRRADSGGYTD